MGITIKFRNYDNDVIKWAKLSLFWIGAIIAIPMLAIAVLLALVSLFTEKFIKWLLDKTNVDVNFQ
jgi:hypothetical protein